jgi:hypothetical protein
MLRDRKMPVELPAGYIRPAKKPGSAIRQG